MPNQLDRLVPRNTIVGGYIIASSVPLRNTATVIHHTDYVIITAQKNGVLKHMI